MFPKDDLALHLIRAIRDDIEKMPWHAWSRGFHQGRRSMAVQALCLACGWGYETAWAAIVNADFC
jgi:hypothetical protein